MIDFVYVLSASHSGSTLLTMILASHPEVASVGETSAVLASGSGDTGLCSCGVPVRTCPFWTAVGQRMAAEGVDWTAPAFDTEFRVDESRLARRLLRAEYRGTLFEAARGAALALVPAWRRRGPQIMRNNLALIRAVAALRGARVFVDSSKEPHRLRFFMAAPELCVKVIHLVRDGRGVAASYRRTGLTTARAIDEWRRSIRSEEHILGRFDPGRVVRVRYEDLCADPSGCAARLFSFMGVDPRHSIRDFASADHHILGNRMRMNRSVDVREDRRWVQTLTHQDLALFERMAGRLNRRYGYDGLAPAGTAHD